MTQEALRRIISTLANKNEELENFLESVDNTLTGLQVRAEGAGPENHLVVLELKRFLWNQDESCKVTSDLEAELELLRSTLEEKGAELRDIIREETQRKEAELQVASFVVFIFNCADVEFVFLYDQKQLSEGKSALLSCEELLEFANKALTVTDEEEFLKVESEEGVLLKNHQQGNHAHDLSLSGCKTNQRTVGGLQLLLRVQVSPSL